jgi:hypothetical protein
MNSIFLGDNFHVFRISRLFVQLHRYIRVPHLNRGERETWNLRESRGASFDIRRRAPILRAARVASYSYSGIRGEIIFICR